MAKKITTTRRPNIRHVTSKTSKGEFPLVCMCIFGPLKLPGKACYKLVQQNLKKPIIYFMCIRKYSHLIFFTQKEQNFSLYHAATGTVNSVNLPVVFPSVWL